MININDLKEDTEEDKEMKKIVIAIELGFFQSIMDLDNKTIEKGKLFCTDSFMSPAIFAIIYCFGGIVLSLFDTVSLTPDWFFTGVGITLFLALMSITIKWFVWHNLVARAKDSVKYCENEMIKLSNELERLEK